MAARGPDRAPGPAGAASAASTARATSQRDCVERGVLRQVVSEHAGGTPEDGRQQRLVRLSRGEAPDRLEVGGGLKRGRADHLIERGPDLLSKERVREIRQPLEREGQRPLIESDERVVVVAQVRVDEERCGAADRLGHGQPCAADADRERLDIQGRPRHGLSDQAKRRGVRTQGRVLRRRFLPDLHVDDVSLRFRPAHPDRVQRRCLQPQPRPLLEGFAGRLAERREEVSQARVAPGVSVEVALQPDAEGVVTQRRHELFDDGGALLVGDGVEVAYCLVGVLHAGGDGVRRHELVLPMGSRAHVAVEDLPGIGEPGRSGQAAVGEVRRERLVEPQVVPPAHGHQVAEPHVGELVKDRPRPWSGAGRRWAGRETGTGRRR